MHLTYTHLNVKKKKKKAKEKIGHFKSDKQTSQKNAQKSEGSGTMP